jgi:hypothetical protein
VKINITPLLLLFLAGPAFAETPTSTPFMGGGGATTCSKWSAEQKQRGSLLAFGLEGWVVGFVSGAYSTQGTSDPILPVIESNVIERVDSYCYDHPSDRVYQAAANVTADLFALEATQLRGRAAEQNPGQRRK